MVGVQDADNIFIASMEKANEEVASIMENLPVRLDRFWRARILRRHDSEEELLENLKLCIGETHGEDSLQILGFLRERNLLSNYLQ